MSSTAKKPSFISYGLALLACLATTAAAALMHRFLDAANTVMIFLLTVFLVARWLGRGPAVMAAVLCVALFDVVFVPPRFSFAVSDAQYLVTFAVMLAVGLVTAGLTAGLQQQAEAARQREVQAQGLYELARELATVISVEQLVDPLERYMAHQGYQARLHLLDEDGNLPTLASEVFPLQLATLAMDRHESVEMDLGDGLSWRVFPLIGSTRCRGVLIASSSDRDAIANNLQLIGAVASLVALTVERLHYVDVAHASQLEASGERLRSSVLSALSHDLRTPLTALVGMADALASAKSSMDEDARSMAGAIRDQARAMGQLMSNLLDMAKLHAGKVNLRGEWQLLEDVVSSSLNLLRALLAGRQVTVALPPDMPLVDFDAVLMERVICNLLENAAKYSPSGTPIEVRAFVEAGYAGFSVSDRGPGFPPGDIERVFGMFERGHSESATAGVGLGLAICRAIVEAHAGDVTVANRPEGGACVTVRLPLGTPPAIEEEALDVREEAKS